MSGSVNTVDAVESNNKKIQQNRPSQIVVKSGESLSSIAKKFGMSTKQFMQWTGLKKSQLNAGQKINLPSAEIPKGKGILALVKANNMTMEEFGRLNNLPKPYKDYKARAGERFYVIKHSTSAAVGSSPAPKKSVQKSKSPTQNSKTSKPVSRSAANKAKWGSSYSPNEIATNLYQKSCDYYGAVGKPDFDALVNEINPKNVSEVWKTYKQNPKNEDHESLINTITSEVRSDKDKRKAAVIKVYDAVAKRYGTPVSVKKGFVNELNEQFDSWGMVSTKKLDETINRMMASPKELAAKMENDIDSKTSAVGKESFNELLAMVNPRNAAQVIKAYDDLHTGESLINGITSEIGSSKQSRKNAVMHIYNSLAIQKGANTSAKKAFEQELNSQFNSFGMVDTENLDNMINNLISRKTKSVKVKPSKTSAKSGTTKVSGNKIKFPDNPEAKTPEQWRKGAIAGSSNDAIDQYKIFCQKNGIKFNKDDLDLGPLNRIPEPIAKNGKIVAGISPVLKPTTKPNGKVVILNPGHGAYNPNSGAFDPGSFSFIKKSNGKYAPLLEGDKMVDYADKAADKLRSEGYAVVIITGHVKTFSQQDSVSKLINDIASGKLTNQKYDKKNIALISLHADSDPGESGTGVCYNPGFQDDTKLANTLNSAFLEDNWIKSDTHERVWGKNGIQVLRQSEGNPSVLVEVEYVNGSKSKNLDSSAFQGRFLDKLTVGLNRYFGLQ